MSLPNNYFATRTKPYAVLESDLDTINNYLNQIADEVRPPSRGGTGISVYAIGDMMYASATSILSILALATSGHYLTSNGTIPQYRQITQNEVSDLGVTETPTFAQVTTTTKLNTDTIAERTGDTGVTVDGVVMKDSGATFAAPVDMTNQKIIQVAAPTATTDASNKEYVDALFRTWDWQESVLGRLDFTTAEPPSPGNGDRYINTVTGSSNQTTQSVTIHRIYQWNTVDWTEVIPNKGFTTWVEDEGVLYLYNGTTWVKFGTTITHDNTIGGTAAVAHGVTGAVVGTTNTQILTNKTLTSPTIGDLTNSTHDHTTDATGGLIAVGDIIEYNFLEDIVLGTSWSYDSSLNFISVTDNVITARVCDLNQNFKETLQSIIIEGDVITGDGPTEVKLQIRVEGRDFDTTDPWDGIIGTINQVSYAETTVTRFTQTNDVSGVDFATDQQKKLTITTLRSAGTSNYTINIYAIKYKYSASV